MREMITIFLRLLRGLLFPNTCNMRVWSLKGRTSLANLFVLLFFSSLIDSLSISYFIFDKIFENTTSQSADLCTESKKRRPSIFYPTKMPKRVWISCFFIILLNGLWII